jgi:hypothetical protein
MPDSMDAIFGKDLMDRVRAGQPALPDADLPALLSTSLSPTKN